MSVDTVWEKVVVGGYVLADGAFVTGPAIVTDGEVKPMSAPDADLMGM